jgi:prevent-host-death family protein
MAETVNVHEAKTHLSRLLARVESGEEIIIARGGRPIPRLQRLEGRPRKRTPGNDRIVIHRDFDDPIPEWDPDYMHPDDPMRESTT